MVKFTFLKKDILIKFALLSILLFFILPFTYFLIWIFLLSCYLFLFRRNTVTYKNSLSNTVDIILSPASGTVTGLVKDNDGNQYVKIRIPIWGPYGLYLPYSSEIHFTHSQGDKKVWRGSTKVSPESLAMRRIVEFKNKLGHITTVEVFSCIFGKKPDIWLAAGDKGRSTACFGLLPFGGSILVKIPKGANLLINQYETVRAGFTILAGAKG
jgi:hypothetical protein